MASVNTPTVYLIKPDEELSPKENIVRIAHMLEQLLLDSNKYTIEVKFKGREPLDPIAFAESISNIRSMAEQIAADPELTKKINALKVGE